jgi:diapolycopene oxygenase
MDSLKKERIAVIGSGIGGLAVAIRLAAKGHDVTVYEANATAGGKIAEHRAAGFRFDMGPSVLTMPQYIDELFALCGENPRDHFNYHRLDPIFQYFFEDGTIIRTPADTEKLMDELVGKTSVTRENVREFLQRSKEKLELTDPVFLQRSLHEWRNYFDRPTLRGILNFHKVEAFTTMAKANARLFKDAKVEDIFNRYASYNGSDPYKAPATLNLISHYEITLGAYYPKGGMFALTKALVALAGRMGVQMEFNARVERIHVVNGRATGITVGATLLEYDRVVSNADVNTTYDRLMPDQPRPSRTLDQPKSGSAIVFYWGMDRQFPQLQLHNMFMTADAKVEYARISDHADVCDDPTVYLYISAKENTDDAPLGNENWFAMVSVPHDSGQDWDAIVQRTRQNVLAKLSRQLGEDVASHIVYEHVLNPRGIASGTSSINGAIFGNSSNGIFAAFLRHPNFSSGIKELYFCGGSVHPGSSIPLSLLSAKITADIMGKTP